MILTNIRNDKNLKKAEVESPKKLQELSNVELICEADANSAPNRL